MTETQNGLPLQAIDRAARLGRRLALIARLMVVPVLLMPLAWWLPGAAQLMPIALPGNLSFAGLSFEQRVVGTLVNVMVCYAGIAALLALARLGDRFHAGAGLSAATAGMQLRLGRRLLWLVGAQLAYTPLMTLAITAFNPPGQRMLAVGVSGSEFILLVGALVVFLFGRMTEEAARIAEENSQIV